MAVVVDVVVDSFNALCNKQKKIVQIASITDSMFMNFYDLDIDFIQLRAI